MANRQTEMAALIRRCRKVGWEVSPSKSHWIVRPPNGGPQISVNRGNSSSDFHTYANCLSMLEKAGLSQAEVELERRKNMEKKIRAAAAVRAAEAKGLALASKAPTPTAVFSSAAPADPYLRVDEEVPLEWFIKPHPAPWVRRVKLTIDIAKYIVEHHNNDNRPIDKKTVAHYRNIMLAEMWKTTHQGAAMDVRGTLQDAQHRLLAFIEANELNPDLTWLSFIFWVGWPVENFAVIDENRVRVARQLIAKEGIKNAGCIQTCIRLVSAMKDANPRTALKERLPNARVLELFAQAEEEYKEAANWGVVNQRKLRSIASALAAARFLLRRENGVDNEYVEQFLSGLSTGVYPGTRTLLDDIDPRAVLRKRLDDNDAKNINVNGMTQLGMIITSWNNCIRGKEPRYLTFNEESAIPEILRCKPGEGVTPHAFRQVVV